MKHQLTTITESEGDNYTHICIISICMPLGTSLDI